jgi:hypothetical protein
MIITNKLLPVALIAALIGGSVGALVMSRSQPAAAESTTATTTETAKTADTNQVNEDGVPVEFKTAGEQTAYKSGFADGFGYGAENQAATKATTTKAPTRVVSRNATTSSPRRVSYDYNNQPRGRSFWDKHRDKLTLAMGTGAGAAIGGLIGGKKGAAIGALSGAGGSALYTYKLRKRNR